MVRKSVVVLGVTLAVLSLDRVRGAEPLPAADRWLPRGTVLAVEIAKPRELLERVVTDARCETTASLPAYQKATAQAGFQEFLKVVRFLEARFGTDWRKGLGKLTGGGMTWAVTPDGASVLMVDAEDPVMLTELNGIILGFAQGEAQKQGQPASSKTREYRGITGWSLNEEEAHAIVGNRLILANRPAALKAVIDLHLDAAGERLADNPAYQAARKAAGPGVATAFFDLATIKKMPGVSEGLAREQNPFGTLLFGALTDALRGSTWMSLGLSIEQNAAIVRAQVDALAAGSAGDMAFMWPPAETGGVPPTVEVPRMIAGFSLYRDLAAFYAAKDRLFPERTSGSIFFENMMGIFFSGRDITDEVLAEMAPEIRFVVAEQAYDPAVGTPQVKLPSFAAVFRARRPEVFGEILEEAWQKALGLINFTRGQQALPGLIIDKPTQGDTKFSVAYFRVAAEDDKAALPTHYNFRPALARVGEYLILSSTEGLTRDLIDALGRETAAPRAPVAGMNTLVELDGKQLTSILTANRETMIAQNMVEKGNSREEAEAGIDMLLLALGYLDGAKLRLGREAGRPAARLSIAFTHP